MLNEVKRRASRIGFHKVKFITSIHITELILPVQNPVPNDTKLSICFEKGGKISTSRDICYDLEKNASNLIEKDKDSNIMSMAFNLNEYVELITTLYRDPSTGIYQDKQGKVILRQLENYHGLTGHANYFKGIGVYIINLSEIAQCMGHEKYMTKDIKMPMKELDGCYLNGMIRNTIIFTESNNFDDNGSIQSLASDCSHSSTIGASFYYEDIENYVCEDSIADFQSITPLTNRTNRTITPRIITTTHSDYQRRYGSGMHLAEIACERKNIMSPLTHRRPSKNVSFPINDSSFAMHNTPLSKINIFSNIDDENEDNNDCNTTTTTTNIDNNNVNDVKNNNSNVNSIAIMPLSDEQSSLLITNKAYEQVEITRVEGKEAVVVVVMVDKSTSTHEDFEFIEFNRRSISRSNNNSLKNTPIRSSEKMKNKVIDSLSTKIIVENNIDTNKINNDIIDMNNNSNNKIDMNNNSNNNIDMNNNSNNNIDMNNNSDNNDGISINETITSPYNDKGFYSEAFIIIEKELISRNLRIDELEKQLYTRDNNYQKEIIDLQTKLNTIEILNENKINLNKSNNTTNSTTYNNKIDENKIIDINLLNDYGKLLTQTKIMEQDIIYYKQLAINMVKAKTEETLACRKSATAAVISCLKRAEVEQELNDMKEYLEDMDLKYLEINNELINEKQRNIISRNRIQKYAKELGKIEVSYVLSRNNTIDERSSSKVSQKIK